MSSHREAPEISKDPVADSADLYAFVSPDKPDTVTIIANYVPLQAPAGGPNFFEFGDDVLYELHVDNDGDAKANVTYQFRFSSVLTNPNTFLYNNGPINLTSSGRLNAASWNRRQYFSVARVENGKSTTLASNLSCPPCNIGPLSTPDYSATASGGGPEAFTKAFIHRLPTGETVFAGQRADGFYADLGAVFDLGQLRQLNGAHATFGSSGMLTSDPVQTLSTLNVHSIALQVPIKLLVPNRTLPTDKSKPNATIGIYTAASRQRSTIRGTNGVETNSGPYVQVSRLANPLFNELLVPLAKKDLWNYSDPSGDSAFAAGVTNPELGQLLPILFSPNGDGKNTVFPNLEALDAQITAGKKSRADLAAVLLTGIPDGVVGPPGTFANFTGTTQADLLRLNVLIPPTQTGDSGFSNLGVVGGDLAGFPNGRRVYDDVTTIELKAVAGAIYKLVDPSYTPDSAIGLVDEKLTGSTSDITANGTITFLTSFPYLGTPHSGYYTPSETQTATPPNQPAHK